MLTRPRMAPRAAIAGVAITAAAVAGIVVADAQRATPELGQDEILAFEADFVLLARQLGTVVDVGLADAGALKHAVGKVDRGELGGSQLAREAGVWRDAIGDLIERIRALDAPGRLEAARTRFVRSGEQYLAVAEELGRAANADGRTGVDSHLDRAVELGTSGDELFDTAAAVIQEERRRVGLGPTTELPDPASGTGGGDE